MRGRPILLDGAFDPMHAGHVAYIQAARAAYPDHELIVSVCTDDDIRAKGREPFLDQMTRVAVVGAITGVDQAFAKQPGISLDRIVDIYQPAVLVKGKDWERRLPDGLVETCANNGTQIVHLGERLGGSTTQLRRWALADADQSLDRLTAYMAAQQETPPDVYDREYFTGDWRAEGNRYTLDARRAIEGNHPLILSQVFPHRSMLDVGCGPGFLVQMLREFGVEAGGIDPSPAAKSLAVNRWVIQGDVYACPNRMADVVICREVLEHLTVQQLCEMVMHLFRLAKHAVYITTRFQSDQSVFDVTDERDIDPTHQTLLSQPFLRALCVLNGGRRRRDWEGMLDHHGKGRVLCYEVH